MKINDNNTKNINKSKETPMTTNSNTIFNFDQTSKLNEQLNLQLKNQIQLTQTTITNRIEQIFQTKQQQIDKSIKTSQNKTKSKRDKCPEKIDRRFKKYRDVNKNTTQTSSAPSSNNLSSYLIKKQQVFENITHEKETYRIGDWVFCEFEEDKPFSIRKIEEFTKNENGEFEVKLRCAYRRSDISQSLLNLVEKKYTKSFSCLESTLAFYVLREPNSNPEAILNKIYQDRQEYNFEINNTDRNYELNLIKFIRSLTNEQIQHLKEREIFYSRYTESNIPVDKIKSKINVSIFMAHLDKFENYLSTQNEDYFFYQIFYDPNQKLLSQDKAEIRVGNKYQADIPELVDDTSETKSPETLVFDGCESEKIGKIAMTKYFNRIIDEKLRSNEKLNPNCEIMQTRDCLMYDAMRHLHVFNYDRDSAIKNYDFKKILNFDLVDEKSQKVWSKNEMNLFKMALESVDYGKDFGKLRKDFLDNKTYANIIEYYYNIWKINDEYIEKRDEKRAKKKADKIIQIDLPKTCFTFKTDFVDKENIDESQKKKKSKNEIVCLGCNQTKNVVMFKRDKLNYLAQTTTTTTTTTSSSSVTCSNSNTNNFDLQLCNECWLYWKKYASFKSCSKFYGQYISSSSNENFSSLSSSKLLPALTDLQRKRNEERSREERRLQNRYKCKHVSYCTKEFTQLNDFKKHSMYAHAQKYMSRRMAQKSSFFEVTFFEIYKFDFRPSQMAKSIQQTETKLIRKLARNPFSQKNQQLIENLMKTKTDFKMPKKSKNISNKPRANLSKIVKKLIKKKDEKIFINDSILNQSRPLTPISTSSSSSSDFETERNKQKKSDLFTSSLFSASDTSNEDLNNESINNSLDDSQAIISLKVLDQPNRLINTNNQIDDDDDCIIILSPSPVKHQRTTSSTNKFTLRLDESREDEKKLVSQMTKRSLCKQ
ncbi:unnamed protein product [Brachionus calyciflorus]|uniref:Uncharacterized protein n=1 Tax=Brachionus calyciflorus TaxID=104777 RepID=A0A813X3Y5_9BILA|nr:unnamed protein product [Brachionus calyciflorus]